MLCVSQTLLQVVHLLQAVVRAGVKKKSNWDGHAPLLQLLLGAVPLEAGLVEMACDQLLDVTVAVAVGEWEGQQKVVDLVSMWVAGAAGVDGRRTSSNTARRQLASWVLGGAFSSTDKALYETRCLNSTRSWAQYDLF